MAIDIKGEAHISKRDKEEEVEMIKQGYDHVLVEGCSETRFDDSPTFIQLFYNTIFGLLSPLYTDLEPIFQTIEESGANLHRTRENYDILFSTNKKINYAVATLFFPYIVLTPVVLVTRCCLTELYFNELYLLTMLLGILFITLFLLLLFLQSKEREKDMREKVEELSDETNDVLVIVGQLHVSGVKSGEYEVREVRKTKSLMRIVNVFI